MPDYLITWIHLIAAVILIGGLVFTQLVLNPAAQLESSDQKTKEVARLAGQRFRTIAWVCLITLILTGAYQMLNESGSVRIETNWGVVLMVKLFLFAIAFGLMLIHDFIIDPHAPPSKNIAKPSSLPSSFRADNLQKAIIFMTLAVLLVSSYLATM
jgi:putative copper export protein